MATLQHQPPTDVVLMSNTGRLLVTVLAFLWTRTQREVNENAELKKSRPVSALLIEQEWFINAVLYGQNHCVILLCLCGNKAGNPGQCTLTGGQSKHRNQLIVPLRNYYAKKKTRSIFSHLEGTSVVNRAAPGSTTVQFVGTYNRYKFNSNA